VTCPADDRLAHGDVHEAVARLARDESGHVLALLAHRFADLDLADECVQDALVEALGWSVVPDNPGAWLYTVARNRAIDRLRREAAARRRLLSAAPELAGGPAPSADHDEEKGEERMIVEHADVSDETLRLMLLCCHPALERSTQIALTLRLVGGLTTAEIAAAFLVPEATLAQRIVRAKRKIRAAGIPLTIPEALDDRIDALLTVLYLIFNEGYLARASDGIRIDLMDQAVRLTADALALLPARAEVEGLLALELFTRARTGSRLDAGEIVLLEDQDRTRWDGEAIRTANAVLSAALSRMSPGPFQLQAVIASHHANARTAADTDWPAIAATYRQLNALTPSPVIALNHAVAVAMADGAPSGLALLDGIEGLDEYHLYWSARGELLQRSGEADAASEAFRRAQSLAVNSAERRHLDRRV